MITFARCLERVHRELVHRLAKATKEKDHQQIVDLTELINHLEQEFKDDFQVPT